MLIQEDHARPTVGVALVYRVGLRDDPRGFAGLSHVVEHVMAGRTAHVPQGTGEYLESIGAATNAYTRADTTVFESELPSERWKSALWIESERMAYALSALDAPQLEGILRVVRREVQQRPKLTRQLSSAFFRSLYPEKHPYRNLANDHEAALGDIELAQVRWAFQRGYAPSAALLSIVGDVDTADALAAVHHYFDSIRASALAEDLRRAKPVHTPLTQNRERMIVPEFYPEADQVLLSWPTPAWGAPDDAALDVLSSLLSARLGKLFRANGLAYRFGVSQESHALESHFDVSLALAPGVSLGDVVSAVEGELAQLAQPSSEFERMRREWIMRGLRRMESFVTRAIWLAERADSSDDVGDLVLMRYRSLSAEQVAAAARRYLVQRPHVLVHCATPIVLVPRAGFSH